MSLEGKGREQTTSCCGRWRGAGGCRELARRGIRRHSSGGRPLAEAILSRLLRWWEEVSIGRGGEMSIERLSAEAIGVGSGTGRGGHDQAQEKVVVGLGGGRRL